MNTFEPINTFTFLLASALLVLFLAVMSVPEEEPEAPPPRSYPIVRGA